MNDALIRLLLILIAGITLLSGATQIIAGKFVLGIIATSATGPEVHLFQTVGMFMIITGAMFLQSLIFRTDAPAISLWISVQKFAAAILVLVAYLKGYFIWLALGVAIFDAFTGLLAFIFWRRLPR